MTMELLADFVHEILLQEEAEGTILLGHSMGGYAALTLRKNMSISYLPSDYYILRLTQMTKRKKKTEESRLS